MEHGVYMVFPHDLFNGVPLPHLEINAGARIENVLAGTGGVGCGDDEPAGEGEDQAHGWLSSE